MEAAARVFPGFDLDGPSTPIPGFFLDYVMEDLSQMEFRCALYILRHTLGEGVIEAPISLRDFSEGMGVKRRQTLIEALRGLRERGYVFASGDPGKVRSYRFVGVESEEATRAAEVRFQAEAQARSRPIKPDPRKKFPVSPSVRVKVFLRDRICQHCGGDNNLQVDHVRPLTKGGDSSIGNLQLLCRRCNSRKGNRWEG